MGEAAPGGARPFAAGRWKMKTESIGHEVGSGNVFADIGLGESDDRMAKAELARRIKSIVEHRHLTQAEAARVLGTTQPKVSDLLRGRLTGFSVERLIRFLNALDRDVEIVITTKRKGTARGSFRVAGQAATAPPGAQDG
jgi:predicted XRE-type DNA-binding protein